MKEPYLKSVGRAATADRNTCLFSLVSSCSFYTFNRYPEDCHVSSGEGLWVTDIGVTMSVATKNSWERQLSRLSNERRERTMQRFRQVPHSFTPNSQKPQALNAKFLLKALTILYLQFLIINSCLFIDC